MNIYKNFNEKELLIAYNELLDNSGKINSDMQEILTERGYGEEFFAKASHVKVIIKEQGRIAFEIKKLVEQDMCFEDIEEKISSEVSEKDELFDFISHKYVGFRIKKYNSEVDRETLNKSFTGLIVGTFAGVLFLYLVINAFRGFVFYLLIPTYFICYWVIKTITRKTRQNVAVFISTILATILSTVIIFFIFRNQIII